MPMIPELNNLIAGRRITGCYRILTTELAWRTEAPFAVDVSGLSWPPDAIMRYDPSSFNASAWTDVTGLVQAYQYTQSLEQQCDALTLTVPAAWSGSDLDRVFHAMRMIVVLERYANDETATEWLTRACCLSTGYAQRWDAGAGGQLWTVNALDVLMLAGLDLLASDTGTAVYQADLIEVGSLKADGATYELTQLLDDASKDAFEYAIPAGAGIQPNWADRPAPQFWANNVLENDTPLPLAIGGEAVQAVFGEGVLRVGKRWVATDPGEPPNYAVGLGLGEGVAPLVTAHLYRFAHPAIMHRGDTIPADIVGHVTVTASGPGWVTVDADLAALPAALTLVRLDGSGGRHMTTAHAPEDGGTRFTLADTAVVIPPGTPVRYGEANLAADLVYTWLAEAGFQVTDADKPCYAAVPAAPLLERTATPLLLPPLVYHEADRQTRLAALEDLRRRGVVLPSWLTMATSDGRVVTASVQQQFDHGNAKNAAVIPLFAVGSATVDRTDMGVATRVIAYGRARQARDVADRGQFPTVTIADVPGSDPYGLPNPAYAISGRHSRSFNIGGYYLFRLDNLLRRDYVTSDGKKMRPWSWCFDSDSTWQAMALVKQWIGKHLAEITFADDVTIDALELLAPQNWTVDTADWCGSGGTRHEQQIPQIIGFHYLDGNTWRPLASGIQCPVKTTAKITVESAQFDTRVPVRTRKLRLVCEHPWWASWNVEHTRYAMGVWLLQLRAWESGVLRATAELGDTAPFTGTGWEETRTRLRRRTFVVPEVAEWATTDAEVGSLAREWLYETTRNLAPRPVTVFRPDARIGDTVRLALPTTRQLSTGRLFPWQSARAYVLGERVYPTAGNGFAYECIVAGDSGGTEPVWPLTPKQAITDAGVTWTCVRAGSQLTDWSLSGIAAANSDDGVLYWTFTPTGNMHTVTLYRDAARTQPVADGLCTGDGGMTLRAVGDARLHGTVTVVAADPPEIETGIVALPTYLVTAADWDGDAGHPGASKLTLVNYAEPYEA